MDKRASHFNTARKLLIFWTLFIGIGAVAGGLSMIIDPSGKALHMDGILPFFQVLPFADVLFQDFLFSGFALLIVNGLTNLTAAVLLLRRKKTGVILGGIFGSLAALVLIAVIGPIIKKQSPGPVLFRQTRIGQNGKKFTLYKIRSMYMDADERKQELQRQNNISDFDPRIIGNRIENGKQVRGIGQKIREYSLDEFPQFFNILKGDMSLVGTRPPTEDEWERYKYHHRARLAIKPGLTGLWQVSGRSRITDFEEVVRLDTAYINNWSIALDLRILLKTIRTVLKKDGAM